MKRLSTLLAILVLAHAAYAQDIDIRVGTYNVWSHLARASKIRKGNAAEERNWESSKEAVAKQIIDIDCDILAMQEVTSVCRDDLATLVKRCGGKRYKLWWVNTYPEGHRSVVGNAVFYDKKRFKLENKKIYYFSPTPEVMSKGWDEKRYYRASLATVVTDKRSGKQFFLFATHGPLGKEANAHAGELLVEWDNGYNTENLPSIALGDMNARPEQAFHRAMCAHFEDCALVAAEKVGPIGTFNSASGSDKALTLPHRRIDHIYVHSTDKGKFEVGKYEVIVKKYNIGGVEHYPSDHCPVVVDLKLK